LFSGWAADLQTEERDTLGIIEVPLDIQFPEGEANSIDLTLDEFYEQLEDMQADIPSNAQPSRASFTNIYPRRTKTRQQILSIHIFPVYPARSTPLAWVLTRSRIWPWMGSTP
jgi:fatty acid-binding protein DegV